MIHALENITIEIKKGEIIGLIGPNGSGKSTLLKIVCGIYKPTSGRVRTEGEVTPFLQLGGAFLPDLSVKDNIFLYGAIMGLERRDIRKNLKKIIDFAGIGDFIDAEARVLSLGMEERLAFSVVLQAAGDILLFDEAFAMGDCEFRRKGLTAIEGLRKAKKTIILSSHDLNTIRQLCDRTILLDRGRIVDFDDSGRVIDKYMKCEYPA